MSRRYWQLDVFAERPLTGNGLAVFDDASALDDAAMQAWTRELRQFESIFLLPGDDPRAFRARIFTLEEELPFAGHPLLGAAALLHHLRGGDNEQHWTLHLASKSVALRSVRAGSGFYAEMDQGRAEFGATPDAGTCRWFAEAFSLSANDLSGHPPRVVSTGLPYLLLPVTAEALGRARQVNDLQEALDKLGAAFVYLLDVDGREGRTWDNLGLVEDVATGSAAGSHVFHQPQVVPGAALAPVDVEQIDKRRAEFIQGFLQIVDLTGSTQCLGGHRQEQVGQAGAHHPRRMPGQVVGR